MKKRVQINIRGVVQGVNFRYHTFLTAGTLGVGGWVMNLPDGSVQACIEGEEEAVREMVEWCRRGPANSRVDSVSVVDEEFHGEFDSFDIRR